VTLRGQVKILDFGLAKLSRKRVHQAAAGISRSATASEDELLTSPGVAMGTVAYMSPEQARGEEMDARTDLFSFGAVLYEMATGRQAFGGTATAVVYDAILHHEPTSSLELNPELPSKLPEIIGKALEKERNLRYQNAADIVTDLKRLKRDTEPRPAAAAFGSENVPSSVIRFQIILALAGTAMGVLLLLLVGLLLYHRKESPTGAPSEWVQLTNFADSVTSPALSADGRMLAFIRGESTFFGPGQIYVKLLPNGEPLQLTHDGVNKMSPKFSPDGARIAYTAQRASQWDTWVVQVLGGQPRLFLANAEGLTWISAGIGQPRLLFSEMTGRGQQMGIVTSTESRAQQRTVYMPPEESGMAHRSYLSRPIGTRSS
jgi:eukaryotic-like serine/threonine-protein kinase